jgi:hypothetical protein
MHFHGSLDGLQRRYSASGSTADQRDNDEIDGWGEIDPGPVAGLARRRMGI